MSLGGARANKTEQRAFDQLAAGGILSIAAAGNDGNTALSYPAGYASVMSVAALDEAWQWATFSQHNSKVEIAAPGFNVLSTVPMDTGSAFSFAMGGVGYEAGGMDGAPRLTATGALFDLGLGNAVNAGAAGKVCLIARGTVDFATKVGNCQAGGGVGAVVYNNVAGGFGGTLGTTVSTIPSVAASDSDVAAMRAQLGLSATVAVAPASYAFFDAPRWPRRTSRQWPRWSGAATSTAARRSCATRSTRARWTWARLAATPGSASAWCRPRRRMTASSRWAAATEAHQGWRLQVHRNQPITRLVARHIAALQRLMTTVRSRRRPLNSYSHAAMVAFAPSQLSQVSSECWLDSPASTMASTVGRYASTRTVLKKPKASANHRR